MGLVARVAREWPVRRVAVRRISRSEDAVLHDQPATGKSQTPVSKDQRGWLVRLFFWFLSGEFKVGALGLFFVGFGLSELVRQELSILNWRSTQGTVVESQTVRLEQKEGRFGPRLTVRVRYRYTVDGREYESTRITTGEPVLFYGFQDAAEFRKRFPPGSAVKVLYSPYSASDATLIAERGSGPWILLGFGVSGLLLAIFARWRRRRDGEEPPPDLDIPVHWV